MGAAEVALGRLYRDVAEEKLDLLQLAASGTTESSATPAKIVRRKFVHANLRRELFDDMPDELLRHSLAPNSTRATHAAKEAAGRNSSGFRPFCKETLYPIRNRDGSDVPSFPAKVYDCPMFFALLKMAYRQPGEFVATEPTSKEHCKQGSIPFALDPVAIRSPPESLPLVGS